MNAASSVLYLIFVDRSLNGNVAFVCEGGILDLSLVVSMTCNVVSLLAFSSCRVFYARDLDKTDDVDMFNHLELKLSGISGTGGVNGS